MSLPEDSIVRTVLSDMNYTLAKLDMSHSDNVITIKGSDNLQDFLGISICLRADTCKITHHKSPSGVKIETSEFIVGKGAFVKFCKILLEEFKASR